MLHVAIVAVSGGVGCMLRVLARDALMRRGTQPWWTTCVVNLAGAFAMGIACAFFARTGPGIHSRAAEAAMGLLGGWTTYSAFAMDVVQLWLRGSRRSAAVIWAVTLAGAPAAAIAGAAALRALAGGGAP